MGDDGALTTNDLEQLARSLAMDGAPGRLDAPIDLLASSGLTIATWAVTADLTGVTVIVGLI